MAPDREARARYNKLRQTGTVSHYVQETRNLVRELKDSKWPVGDGELITHFIDGLKSSEQQYVEENSPPGGWSDSGDLYEKALNYEYNLSASRARRNGNGHGHGDGNGKGSTLGMLSGVRRGRINKPQAGRGSRPPVARASSTYGRGKFGRGRGRGRGLNHPSHAHIPTHEWNARLNAGRCALCKGSHHHTQCHGERDPHSNWNGFLNEYQDKGNPDAVASANRDGPGTSGGRLQYGYLGTTLKCMDKNPAGSVEKLAYCLANGMFDASRLQNLEQQLGIKFKVDCCASNSGSSSLCPEYYSPSKSFLKSSVSELAEKPLWINPPFHGLANFLKKYTKLKKQSPDVISACILVPKKSGKWKKFLRGMNKVLTLEADSFMYRDPDTHQSLGPHPWTMEVWYDSPKLPVSALRADMMNFHDDAKPLSMLFGGTLENKPANFLVDTGASHNFVDRSFAMKHKLTWLGESGEVNCGGRHTAQISGTLETYAKVQGFASSQKFYVTDLPFSVDCIFGQTWLEDHKALVDYDKRVVRFRIRGQQRGYLRCWKMVRDCLNRHQEVSLCYPACSSRRWSRMGTPPFL